MSAGRDPDLKTGVLEKSSTDILLGDDEDEREKLPANMNGDALASREAGIEDEEDGDDDALVLVDSEGNEEVVDEDEFFEDVLQTVLGNEDKNDDDGDEPDEEGT